MRSTIFPVWRQSIIACPKLLSVSLTEAQNFVTWNWNRDMLKSSAMKRRTNKLIEREHRLLLHRSKAANFPIDLNEKQQSKREKKKYQVSVSDRKRGCRKSMFKASWSFCRILGRNKNSVLPSSKFALQYFMAQWLTPWKRETHVWSSSENIYS